MAPPESLGGSLISEHSNLKPSVGNMGIRFCCPNGHRLHVKSFLAGKRGICPHCNAKVQIPLADKDIATGTRQGGSVQSRTGTGNGATGVAPRSAPNVPLESAASKHHEFKGVAPAAPVAKQSHASDLIEPPARENADTWFVRPPSGGQFGPASTGVLRRWITEGRVTADAFVWREGWGSWQKAEEVLEYKLAAQSISNSLDRKQLLVDTEGESMLSRVDRHRLRKPPGISKNLTTVVILATISIVLLVALVYVIVSR